MGGLIGLGIIPVIAALAVHALVRNYWLAAALAAPIAATLAHVAAGLFLGQLPPVFLITFPFAYVGSWGVALAVGIPFRVRRRPIPPDHCQACGYNLTGNISGVCPECGARIVPGSEGPARRGPPG